MVSTLNEQYKINGPIGTNSYIESRFQKRTGYLKWTNICVIF